ncbi:DEAD-domain-containing protein [Pholiota conissans]|uniref:ATP-dependent RNA helicase n=1 Tax=Pholiota conissans TaxID=109636 RepID=A0A9P5ZCC0_9AGAR|nr:DEAD-domain-containing protein [Pholiota conissans]
MLLARNASTAAARARIPATVFAGEEEETTPKSDKPHAFSTVSDKLHPHTMKAIKHTHMSIVQSRIFPLLPHLAEPHDPEAEIDASRPRDLLVKAKTGTGKTMAFLVPAIEARLKAIDADVARAHIDSGLGSHWTKIDAARAATNFASDTVGTLILSPTRELATQIAVEASNLTAHHKGFQVQVLLGGESKGRQIGSWERGRKDVVVATPGRLMDLLDSVPMFKEALAHTKILILDEADTLLDMGFRPDIERISSFLPSSPERQTFLFSATVSRAIQDIARTLLSPSHSFVNCVSDTDVATHTHIPQYTTILPGAGGAEALPHLIRLIAHDQLLCARDGRKSKVIVFLSTTKMTQLFASLLAEATTANPAAFPTRTRTYEMHAKREMSTRVRVSNSFRTDVAPSTASVLITSDVSARGVDYPGVTRVIQLGIPPNPDMYVHRVGRTGRGGDRGGQGRGDLVVCGFEEEGVRRIERAVGIKTTRVETTEIERECLEMLKDIPIAESTPASSSRLRAPAPYGPANLEIIPEFCQAITARLAEPPADYPDAPSSDEFGQTFLSQLGFYIGRGVVTGLRGDHAAAGLQAFFKELGGLSKDLRLSRGIQTMLGGGENSNSNNRRRSNGGSAYAGGWDRNRSSGGGRDGYRRGDPQREGYRQREGGSYGYTPAAGRRSSPWEGATGRSSNQYTRDRNSSSSRGGYGRQENSSSSYGGQREGGYSAAHSRGGGGGGGYSNRDTRTLSQIRYGDKN